MAAAGHGLPSRVLDYCTEGKGESQGFFLLFSGIFEIFSPVEASASLFCKNRKNFLRKQAVLSAGGRLFYYAESVAPFGAAQKGRKGRSGGRLKRICGALRRSSSSAVPPRPPDAKASVFGQAVSSGAALGDTKQPPSAAALRCLRDGPAAPTDNAPAAAEPRFHGSILTAFTAVRRIPSPGGGI